MKTIALSILDGYKVRWSRETVARDVVQNFFDEAPDFDDVKIEVDVAAKRIRVEGPSVFALDYLKYLGATTKRTRRAAGGFGEGFKVCALVLLRDYKVALRAGSGRWEIAPRLEPHRLGRELVYDVATKTKRDAFHGSFVEITNADDRLSAAFNSVRDLFRHAKNPRLAKPMWEDAASGMGIYESLDRLRGDVFYRKQHRGILKLGRGNAITIACDETIAGLPPDRDRRDLRHVQKVIAAVFARAPDAAIEQVIRRLRPYWMHGNAVLNVALREAQRRKRQLTFSDRWVANVASERGLQNHATRRGVLVAATRFANIGMQTLTERFGAVDVPRPPTPVERARIKIAIDLYEHLTGEHAPLQALRVLDSRPQLFARKRAVVVAQALAEPFALGIAEVLTTLARLAGDDEATNADRLTALLEGVAREAGRLRAFENRWTDAKPANAPLEGEDEIEDEMMLRGGHLHVTILAPPGFPKTAEIERRIRALATKRRLAPWFFNIDVSSEDDAIKHWARGIPSVWIRDVEIEPRLRRPSYEVRTFDTPIGPSLVPSDEALDRALAKQEARRTRRIKTARRAHRGRQAFERLLETKRPLEYRKYLEEKALKEVGIGDLPLDARDVIYARAQPALVACDVDGLAPAARAAVEKAAADVRAVLEEVRAAVDALAEDVRESVFNCAVTHVCELLAREDAIRAATDAAVTHVGGLGELSKRAAAAGLDPACTNACRRDAFDHLDDDGGVARLDRNVQIARARHARLGLDACKDLREELSPTVEEVEEPDPVALAVRAAWDAAIGRGETEIDAACASLDAARKHSTGKIADHAKSRTRPPSRRRQIV